MIYDVIIIGLGPAGYGAAIYAKRGGLNTLVLEGAMPGGLLNYTNVVNNYPGFISVTGPELSQKMYAHFKTFDIDYKNENVEDIQNGEIKKVITSKGEYQTKNVIIATGRSRRSLNLRGEKELYGHGISYCAMCDGHFYKGKDVAVVGSGDSSMEETLYLANLVNKVHLIVRGKLSGKQALVDSVLNTKNIEIHYGATIEELKSENGFLKSIILNDKSEILVSGLFVYIGFDPVIPFKTDLEFDKDKGYLLVNENCETSVPGIYACGDIVKKKMYQIISAEYEGATAASDIISKLTKK